MFRLVLFIVFAVGIVSCATPPSKFDELSASDKVQLNETMIHLEKLSICSDQSQGNDAAFTSNCKNIISGKKLHAKFRKIDAAGGDYTIIADVSDQATLICRATPSSETTDRLSSLKPMDDIILTGEISRYSREETKRPANVFQNKMVKMSHRLELSPCTISF